MLDSDEESIDAGANLKEEQATQLEKQLSSNPSSVSARLKLISYYLLNGQDRLCKRANHILWMIDHHPGRRIWRSRPTMGMGREYPQESFELASELWSVKINECFDDPNIVGNAGIFLIERNFDLGFELLLKASQLSPEDDLYPNELSRFCFWKAEETRDSTRERFAFIALETGEHFLRAYGDKGARANSALRERGLYLCAQCAFWVNDLEKSKRYAGEHVVLVSNWNDRPKSSRSMLGLIALAEGNIQDARSGLLTLEKRMRLNHLDLQLANELIKAGDLGTVIEYLEKCKKLGFWSNRNLDKWIASLDSGEKPVLA